MNKEELSKLMFLGNFEGSPDDLSCCHICLKKKSLSREHIPPFSAFNDCNRLWDMLICAKDNINTRSVPIRGGFWVRTLCEECNSGLCAPYAKEYVSFVRDLVESPNLFDSTGKARVKYIKQDTLFLAKEIAVMILAVEPLAFARHNAWLRAFVLNRDLTIESPNFSLYGFIVPDVKEAGTITRFHARVDTFSPGYYFCGGEISWYPFGVVYASHIGKGYDTDEFTDITNWFRYSDIARRKGQVHSFFTRVTGVESIQSALGRDRDKPQIDYLR